MEKKNFNSSTTYGAVEPGFLTYESMRLMKLTLASTALVN